jgi:phage terminase large subunit GpA-like protein
MANAYEIELAASIKPDDSISYWQWADKHFELTREFAAEYGRYRSSRTPFVREPLYELSPLSETQIVVVIKPTQLAGTTIGLIFLLAMMDVSPGPALFIGVTDEKTGSFSKKKLTPSINACEKIKGKIRSPRSRQSGNTIMLKEFPGGSLMLTGSNSPASYRAESIKYLIIDDFDGFELDIGGEGSPEELADRRTGSFPNRKVYINSTTTVKEMSNIEAAWEHTSQGYFNVPCPHCGYYQYLIFGDKTSRYGIKFKRDRAGEITDIWYECKDCHKKIDESNKPEMVKKGKYVHKYPSRATKGFRYNALVTPIGWINDWKYIAKKFIEAAAELKRGLPAKMKTWTNSFAAEPFEEIGERPIWSVLRNRCEDYLMQTVPEDAQLLTAGVDTQDNRLEFVVRAWGAYEESWLVYHDVIPGDPSEGECFVRLDEVLNYPYMHDAGYPMFIVSMAIDAMGHRTQAVYNYARVRYPRVMAIQGGNTIKTPILKPNPSMMDVAYGGKIIKKGVRLWTVGSWQGKQQVYSRLNLREGVGVYHWPKGTTEEYFRQLTSEKLVKKKDRKGRFMQEWIKTRDNNEALDCEVYAYAAALRSGLLTLRPKNMPFPKKAVIEKSKSRQAPIEKILEARNKGYKRPNWLNR